MHAAHLALLGLLLVACGRALAGSDAATEPAVQEFSAPTASDPNDAAPPVRGNATAAARPAPAPSAAAAAPAPGPNANATSTLASASPSGRLAEYAKVLALSWRFFYAQRSGKLSGGYNPVPWRGDSHLGDRVPGGFHDAGDHLKLNFPLATSLAFLAWGALEFPAAYAASGTTQAALDNLRCGAGYLMGCHPADGTYIAQIGDPGADHAYWGRPEDQTGSRPAYVWDASKPASDAAAAAASALASASLLFRPSDPEFAGACLDHARRLFAFASQVHEGKYSDSQPGPTYVYPSTNFEDDLAFAAAWLWRATDDDAYLAAAQQYLRRAQFARNYFPSWDSVFVPADILLASLGAPAAPGVDHAWQINAFVQTWQRGQNGVTFTPRGLAVPPLGGWGNLRHAANAAFMMALHAKRAEPAERAACLAWAQRQLDYMLGLGGSARSFVVGYGNNPPVRPHHRAASCPDRPAPCTYETAFNAPGPNPQVLAGALVGGPSVGDEYDDRRSDYQRNEVAIDYNAGFTGALAGLLQLLPAAKTSA